MMPKWIVCQFNSFEACEIEAKGYYMYALAGILIADFFDTNQKIIATFCHIASIEKKIEQGEQ